MQEAFKRMILREETIKQPKAWLYRTVRNLCISHLRKHQRMQKEGEEKQLDFFAGKFDTSDDNNNPAEKLERTEKINRVLHFISLLPEDSKTLIKMKFEEKLSYREISQKTGLTEGNVGYKLHHLLRRLGRRTKIGRNHLMSKDDMEERIIAYLLGECDEEEAFEMEKMCRENPNWQAEKSALDKCLD